MSGPGEPDSRGGGDDLVGDLIAEVARTHGIAISRDDPVIAVVLLNQLVLRHYLEEAVAPAAAAIREATRKATAEIEQLAQAQAAWLEQVSLKDRAAFLEDQKALHKTWKTEMENIVLGQTATLRKVVIQAATALRTQDPSASTIPPLPIPASTAPPCPLLSSCPSFCGRILLAAGGLLALVVAALWLDTTWH